MTRLPLLALASCLAACTNVNAEFFAPYANQAPVIDGVADEAVWQMSQWHPINVPIIGGSIDAPDFAGRYKLLWTESALYLTAEITDDKLFDQNPDPLIAYWDDDCLEFVEPVYQQHERQHAFGTWFFDQAECIAPGPE